MDIISALSKFTISVAPFVILPISLIFNIRITLLISSIFLVHYVVVSTIKFAHKGFWDSIAALAEIPLLCLIGAAVWYGLPGVVITGYKHVLDWAGPIILLVEGAQLTRCITLSGKRIISSIEDYPDRLPIIKVLVIGGSLGCYILCGYLTYELFSSAAMNVPFASFTSSVLTCLVALNILSIFSANGVLTDAAVLSVYVTLCCRFALLQMAGEHTFLEKKLEPTSYFSSWFSTFQVTADRVFTLDYLLASTLSAVALFTLSFPTEILDDENFGSEKDQAAIWQILKDATFKILSVTLYTHLILQFVGHIASYSIMWRIAQVVICILFYFVNLLQQKYQHEHYD